MLILVDCCDSFLYSTHTDEMAPYYLNVFTSTFVTYLYINPLSSKANLLNYIMMPLDMQVTSKMFASKYIVVYISQSCSCKSSKMSWKGLYNSYHSCCYYFVQQVLHAYYTYIHEHLHQMPCVNQVKPHTISICYSYYIANQSCGN